MPEEKDLSSARPAFDMEMLLGTILLFGVLLSAIFLVAGILWRWIATGHAQLDYTITGTNLFEFWMTDIRQITSGDFRPRLLVNIGIAFLLITPYIRVAASVIYFAAVERNLKYTVFTAFVLTILTYSLFLR